MLFHRTIMLLSMVIQSYESIIIVILSVNKHSNYASLREHNNYASVWKNDNYASILLLCESILYL